MATAVSAKRLILAALVVLAAQAAPSAAHGQGVCARAPERAALEIRVLQTELMVAALACGEYDRYNAFIRKFRGDISGGVDALKSIFGRAAGGAPAQTLNRFVTRLANQASLRSLTGGRAYCRDAAALFTGALGAPAGELWRFSSSQGFANSHGVAECRVDARPAFFRSR